MQQELTAQLRAYHHVKDLPGELTQLLRPHRLALRDRPTAKALYTTDVDLWLALTETWKEHAGFLDQDDRTVVEPLTTLAYLILTLCTENPTAQSHTLSYIEPHLRRILLYSSSFVHLQDASLTSMTRVMCQAIANMVTGNEDTAEVYFAQRLENERTDNLISRLIASDDQGTLHAVMIFLLNSIQGSASRCMLLATSKSGAAILDRILVLAAVLFDEEEEHGVESENSSSDVFSFSYAIIHRLIREGAFPAAYLAQASPSSDAVDSAQLTLLKFLDGYLQLPTQAASPSPPAVTPFLLATLSALSRDQCDEGRVQEARDAIVFQAIALVILGLSSVGLATDDGRRDVMEGIEDAAALLRLADNLSKGVTTVVEGDRWIEPAALGHLKRTCVRFLGIVSFDQKEAQDRIRESGGLTLMLGMCQIDDSNVTMREHAMFAIRNVLKNNERNQELISGMTPQYLVGPQGELRDLPPALRQRS